MKSGPRGAIVVVAICSWFAISNHCALATLATKTDSVQAGCPFHSKPKEKPPTGAQCCKILRAVTPVVTKSWVRDDTGFSGVDFCTEECPRRAEQLGTVLAVSSLDTGPPGLRSFAELILQRSLFAHAPPIAA
ncbi:MAG TPA: hypothetical protein VE867_01450 [Candidatus Binatia bacterium]|jgi:hypothetical protein|nr:hypothetical protein [Candidatus Binatia bacterium]